MVTHTHVGVSLSNNTSAVSCSCQFRCVYVMQLYTRAVPDEKLLVPHITTSAKCPQPLEKNHFFPKLTLRDICTPNLCGSRARTRLLMSSSPLVSKPRWRTCSEHTCSYLFHTLKTKIRNCFSALFAVRVCMLEASATFRTSGM